jgi:demethylmenaquinone methyltransferase/2-methoxy-6-polyprenyl-1,4-benzoquinol methylase
MGSPLGTPDRIEETGRAVQRMFAAVAPRYDFLNHLLSLGLDVRWRYAASRALQAALAQPRLLVLDVCCGTGDLALALARHAAGRVVAADFCLPMLERARHKAKRSGKLPITLLAADALTLPFPDNSVDVITSAFGFRNLANYALGLREMWRVLRPAGTLAILEFSRVRWPVFGPIFRAYSAHVLPRIGTWISGVKGPYQYLHDSVKRFPDQEGLAQQLVAAGFVSVRYQNYLGGVAALHLGLKPGAAPETECGRASS